MEIQVQISAGKKDFTVEESSGRFTLTESGSVAAVITRNNGAWKCVTGSYTDEDAAVIGSEIDKQPPA